MLFAVRRLRPFRGGCFSLWRCNCSDGLEEAGRGASHAPTCTHGHSTLRAWRSDAMWRSSSDTTRPPELQIPIVCFLYIWQWWNSLFAPSKCNLTSLAVQWVGGQASKRANTELSIWQQTCSAGRCQEINAATSPQEKWKQSPICSLLSADKWGLRAERVANVRPELYVC